MPVKRKTIVLIPTDRVLLEQLEAVQQQIGVKRAQRIPAALFTATLCNLEAKGAVMVADPAATSPLYGRAQLVTVTRAGRLALAVTK